MLSLDHPPAVFTHRDQNSGTQGSVVLDIDSVKFAEFAVSSYTTSDQIFVREELKIVAFFPSHKINFFGQRVDSLEDVFV